MASCAQHLDCVSCLAHRDPYCGWCVLLGRSVPLPIIPTPPPASCLQCSYPLALSPGFPVLALDSPPLIPGCASLILHPDLPGMSWPEDLAQVPRIACIPAPVNCQWPPRVTGHWSFLSRCSRRSECSRAGAQSGGCGALHPELGCLRVAALSPANISHEEREGGEDQSRRGPVTNPGWEGRL